MMLVKTVKATASWLGITTRMAPGIHENQ